MPNNSAKAKVKIICVDLIYDIVGCLLFALGTQIFDAPNNIAPGGVTGISILINYLTGLPVSILSFAFNIPLLILAFIFLGKKFTMKTLKSVIVMTITLEVVHRFAPVYTGETILAALYGGVLAGAGLAVVFMRASTTGGMDIVVRLIQKKRPDFSIGRLMLILDACVLLAAALVYKNIENALYALISIFTCSRLVDSIIYGMDVGKVMMIVSQQYHQVALEINEKLGRGCTLLDARGTYTNQQRPVVMCAIRNSQYFELKKLVYSVDPSAFILTLEANEILGEGFKAFEVTKPKE